MDTDTVSLAPVDGLLWTPLRVRPRREKKVAEYCRIRNILCYLPLRRTTRRYQRRNVEFFLPMFPGYVFCAIDEDRYQEIVVSGHVAGRLTVDAAAEKQLLGELNAVRQFEELSRLRDVLVMPELAAGVSVIVRSGPLRGIRGIVERRKGTTLVAVNIELLGQSIAAEVDAGELELDS
jgi:transcription antitermination factor NusG